MAADNTIDIVINQKASFSVTFNVRSGNAALNLTGYTAAAALKTDFNTPDNQAIMFDTSIPNPTGGAVTIELTPQQTANLALQRYFYDVTITSPNGFKTRVVEGTVRVSGGVS